MQRTIIAAIDAARARVCKLERDVEAGSPHETLVELEDLVNPVRRQRPSEVFSETRPGSHRVSVRDDHRDAHVDHFDAEFAKTIVHELDRILQEERVVDRLIVCAAPRMLGIVRARLDELHGTNLVIDEVPRDLLNLNLTELRSHLEGYGILPPRPAFA